ncbi:nineteen complex-related protein 2-domain-containing protein [Kockovaella imperatae]|uniref:Nineteen complex-related protein 2-domain-containing protein n=1 Tax=Kockovaella imperatae TaxID=4999 RepID=A0A1Y1UKC0_9TREE|nr:nineteen complex-related protein 2-domain-containing protein [Kockovaella imperatae]ORX37954.1 nineteen complex-related protein 2-domain-containing protein [Kockovaella imperatae]
MFVKRNKSRPSLRARDTDDDDDVSAGSPLAKSSTGREDGSVTGDAPEDGGSVMERIKAKAKEKKSSGKGSRLSFGGDASEDVSSREGTPFKAKKSLLSQSFKLPTTDSPVASSSSRTYSSEYLSELKAATPSKAPQRVAMEDGEEDECGISSLAQHKYATQFSEDVSAGIPDPAAVAAAKMKRQAAVESAKHDLGEDYIALGGGQLAVYDGEKGPHPESRLMREDDEGEEGDEDLADYTEVNDKIFLGKKANKAAARRLRGDIGDMIEDREADSESDEDTKEWEEAQARRAGRVEDMELERILNRGYIPAPIPASRPVPTLGPAQARLAKSLTELRLNQAEATHNLEGTAKELAMLEEQEKQLRLEVERMEGKREWVEEFRIWVDTLGKFLEEKIPRLEEIEKDALHHLTERQDLVNKRRYADISDDLSLFLGSPMPDPEDVDEMGRSRESEAGPSSAVRRSRRSDREARRSRRRTTRPAQEDEGYSTDSSLAQGDAEDYRVAQRNLSRSVQGLLEDVKAEDFRDPTLGLAKRFGDWRKRYEEEYLQAFGGLALVQAWEFWVRGELIGWEPFRDSTSLESFTWFTALHEYCHPRETNGMNGDIDMEGDPPLSPEGDLVVDMVAKAVVPLLNKIIQSGGYDAYSSMQTRKALDLVEVVRDLVGPENKKYLSLLSAVFGVFTQSITNLSDLITACSRPDAIPPPAFDPASRFATQRFARKCIKLLRNIVFWRRCSTREVQDLVNLLVGEVLRPVLTKTWEGGGKEMAEKIAGLARIDLRPDLATFLRDGPGYSR